MMLFHLQTVGAGRYIPSFFEFSNKILKDLLNFFENVTFFRLCCFFFY